MTCHSSWSRVFQWMNNYLNPLFDPTFLLQHSPITTSSISTSRRLDSVQSIWKRDHSESKVVARNRTPMPGSSITTRLSLAYQALHLHPLSLDEDVVEAFYRNLLIFPHQRISLMKGLIHIAVARDSDYLMHTFKSADANSLSSHEPLDNQCDMTPTFGQTHRWSTE